MKTWAWDRMIQWWWIDAPLAAAAAAVAASQLRAGSPADPLGQLALADRRGVYTDLITITVAFATLVGVVFTIYVTFGSRRVRQVKDLVGVQLLQVWLAAAVSPWFSALVVLGAKTADRGAVGSHNWSRWVAFGALLFLILQLLRVTWVFYQLARLDLEGDRPTRPVAERAITLASGH